jgi:hypothetical protein
MALLALAYFFAVTVVIVGWYLLGREWNRREGKRVVRLVDQALSGHGHIAGIRWISPSTLLLPIRLAGNVFRSACIHVHLTPREWPLRWLTHRILRREALLSVQADFDLPPGFQLQLMSQRWFGRSDKKLKPEQLDYELQCVQPIVFTTRREWQRDIQGVMAAVLNAPNRDFVSVEFKKYSPHFTAELTLDTLLDPQTRGEVFSVLRDLAEGPSQRTSS